MLPSFQSWSFEQCKRSLLPSSPSPRLAAGSTTWALETTGGWDWSSTTEHLCLLSPGPWSLTCRGALPQRSTGKEEKAGETGWHYYCFHFLPKKATVPNAECHSAKCQSTDQGEQPQELADLKMWAGLGGKKAETGTSVTVLSLNVAD